MQSGVYTWTRERGVAFAPDEQLRISAGELVRMPRTTFERVMTARMTTEERSLYAWGGTAVPAPDAPAPQLQLADGSRLRAGKTCKVLHDGQWRNGIVVRIIRSLSRRGMPVADVSIADGSVVRADRTLLR